MATSIRFRALEKRIEKLAQSFPAPKPRTLEDLTDHELDCVLALLRGETIEPAAEAEINAWVTSWIAGQS
jgi:hypothetical protein